MASLKSYVLGLLVLFGVPQSSVGEETCVGSIGGLCPLTWVQLQARCYKVTASQTHTWHEAKQACVDMGGTMVVPRSDEETDFLVGLQSQTWLNCNDLQTEGVWVCQEGSTNVDYRNWGKNEPNNLQGKEHCAVIKKGSTWTDIPCSEPYPAVCTRPTHPLLHL